MNNETRKYKHKLNFYYNLLIIYMLFLVMYVLVRGEFSNEKFSILFKDPILYIVLIFILYFLFMLIMNVLKAKVLLFNGDKIILKNRFGQRELDKSEILFVKFSRERKRNKEDKSHIRIVKLKLKDRKRMLRIRVSEFNNENELIGEFKNISRGLSKK